MHRIIRLAVVLAASISVASADAFIFPVWADAPQAPATGGYYDEYGFHEVGEGDDACKGRGGIIATRDGTTGIHTRPDGTSYWFHTMVYTCGDGSEISVEIELADLAEYVPDSAPPGPVCEDGYYTDDGWVEGGCV